VAGKVRLFEHDDFEQAMLRAAEHFDVSEQFIEKDYYVTEILRMIADRLGDRAMFKGGTSLSKGWDLISRFSEDIDLFVNRDRFDPPPGKNKTDKILKELTETVGEHPALTWLPDESVTVGGLGREDYFAYDTRFPGLPGIRPAVRLEPGVQSGTFPTEVVPITSLVAQHLQEQGQGDIAEDLAGFDMTLLHYRRTFVEKLFALHGKVVRLQQEGPSARTRRPPLP
jgi:Nucleotidyl transferase AbiEii toxin, Type IV TA system